MNYLENVGLIDAILRCRVDNSDLVTLGDVASFESFSDNRLDDAIDSLLGSNFESFDTSEGSELFIYVIVGGGSENGDLWSIFGS